MKQVVLNSAQEAEVIDTDVPRCQPREVLIAVRASLISTGTETAGYKAGGLVSRGLREPSRVGLVLESIREHGVRATVDKVRAKSQEQTFVGYSGAGIVVAVGDEVRSVSVGDRVAYMGAPHAEYVSVGELLCAVIPEGVSFEEAAFGAVACIALHGVRLAEPRLGERAIVVGLGLVGQLAAQFARANGLGVIGVEPRTERREIAARLGAVAVIDPSVVGDLGTTIASYTDGMGADVAFLCAAIGESGPTNTALSAMRDRGTVVMIGDMGLELDRGPMFSKELVFRVSRSYGPGRYDAGYEQHGSDYPAGFVRWTEQRNLACFLECVADGRISVRDLITEVIPVERANEAYDRLTTKGDTTLAIALSYDAPAAPPRSSPLRRAVRRVADGSLRVGVIGAGGFVTANLLPHFRELDAHVVAVANRSPRAFASLQAVYRPELMTTSAEELLEMDGLDAIIVGSRHGDHPRHAAMALAKGLPVHLEKPLAITLEDAENVAQLVRDKGGLLTIGFNRRFAPTVLKLKERLDDAPAPRHFLYRVNAPVLPANHWSLDPIEGGGRLVGEGCHFVDLVCFLAGSAVASVSGGSVGGRSNFIDRESDFVIVLGFENGDVGTVHYSGQGNAALPKERLEVFCGGRAWVIDDFQSLSSYGEKTAIKLAAPDKGFRGHLENFFDAVRGKATLTTTVDDGVVVARIIEAWRGFRPATA